MENLPPFDTLIAFDATLRHRSMTLAAVELGITQSAVSHRLRKLERFMGTPVLQRSAGGITATAAGVVLADGLAELISSLSSLRARCRATITPAGLRVGVGSALADYWLVRRLPSFTADNPDIAIELIVVDDATAGRASDVDVQVVWQLADDAKSSSTQRLLFREHVFPVCHPRLLPDGRPLQNASGLQYLPLLHKGTDHAARGTEWSWSLWFERLDLTAGPQGGIRFAKIGTAIAAALQGAGVVLARSLLVREALEDNRLCRVLDDNRDMPSTKAHIVRWPAAMTNDRRVQKFVTWITAEASAA